MNMEHNNLLLLFCTSHTAPVELKVSESTPGPGHSPSVSASPEHWPGQLQYSKTTYDEVLDDDTPGWKVWNTIIDTSLTEQDVIQTLSCHYLSTCLNLTSRLHKRNKSSTSSIFFVCPLLLTKLPAWKFIILAFQCARCAPSNLGRIKIHLIFTMQKYHW